MDLAKGLHRILIEKHLTIDGWKIKTTINYTLNNDGSVFTHTPPHYLDQAIASFENFTMKSDEKIPELIRQAIAHWIFEQIHPFPDGNGRVGRIITPLLLQYKKIVDTPFAIISEAIENQKREYLNQFERLHETGDWVPWCRFFLSMLNLNANKNIQRIEYLESLRMDYQKRVSRKSKGSRLPEIVQDLFKRPRFTRKELQDLYNVSPRGASLLVNDLISLGMVRIAEPLKQRNIVYEAFKVLETVLR
jgi:Fic family protein